MRRWRIVPAVLVVLLGSTGCAGPRAGDLWQAAGAAGAAGVAASEWDAVPVAASNWDAVPVAAAAGAGQVEEAFQVAAAGPASGLVTTVEEFPLTLSDEVEPVANVLTTDPNQIEDILIAAAAEPSGGEQLAAEARSGQPPLSLDATTAVPNAPIPAAPAPAAPVTSNDEAELAIVDGSGQAATAPVEADNSFQSIAVTWPKTADAPQLQVRVRDATGAWGPWQPLEDDGAYPDYGTQDMSGVRSGTDTIFVGDADAFQIATIGSIAEAVTTSDARIATINTPKAALGSAGQIVSAAYHPDQAQAMQFAAAVAAPRVYSRAEWGAAARTCTWPSATALKGAIVHHTAGSNSYSTQAQAMQQIRNDQAYHQKTRGWCDLGYNFVVDKWGNVYEGATGSLNSAVIGAHTGGFNTGTVGISMLGDFTSITPDSSVVNAVARVAAWRLNAYGVSPTGTMTLSAGSGNTMGWATGSLHTVPVIAAHRDLGNTECPGTQGYRQMDTIRSIARNLVATPVAPAPTTKPATPAPVTPTTVAPAPKPPVITLPPVVTLATPTKAQLDFRLTAKKYTGAAQPVTVTPRPGIGVGAVKAVYYNGSTTVPKDSGTYRITVDLAAGTKYAAKNGLELGNYQITPVYPGRAQFVVDQSGKTLRVNPKPGVGTITAIYYNNSTTYPTKPGTYQVKVDVAGSLNYKARRNIGLGNFKIS